MVSPWLSPNVHVHLVMVYGLAMVDRSVNCVNALLQTVSAVKAAIGPTPRIVMLVESVAVQPLISVTVPYKSQQS